MAVEAKSASFREVSEIGAHTDNKSRLTILASRLAQGLRRLLFEIAPLFLIIGSFWLQIRMSNQTTGFVSSILTMLIFMVELGLLTLWSFALP